MVTFKFFTFTNGMFLLINIRIHSLTFKSNWTLAMATQLFIPSTSRLQNISFLDHGNFSIHIWIIRFQLIINPRNRILLTDGPRNKAAVFHSRAPCNVRLYHYYTDRASLPLRPYFHILSELYRNSAQYFFKWPLVTSLLYSRKNLRIHDLNTVTWIACSQ